jgi:hypothetical protein
MPLDGSNLKAKATRFIIYPVTPELLTASFSSSFITDNATIKTSKIAHQET